LLLELEMPAPATTWNAITTARLRLEPLRSEFAPALFTHINDWEVMRWLAAPPWPYRLQDMHDWMTAALTSHSSGSEINYAITLAGAPIGALGVTGLRTGPVLGYWLARPFWGSGYMSEATDAIVQRLFDAGHGFVASGVLEGNEASLRVQAKLGFRVVNERFIHARPHGRLMPHLDTVLGRPHWSDLRQAA
jgi:RimJ/RimL family protein N-acetyltransferase